ncbi:TetR/AcrR family transcriptional regulator [Fodinicola acaciae]|uniref:TetR/AcrR family transcriptional regulator n=1 Tax=Fodinicola acaciae TaxID=2681555 RepID=UPI0013D539D9|nr:TetR family transcriptional regulator [Fodinicola acaciae]
MSVRRSSPASLLEIATEQLLADPSASLADVAQAAGMSRTSLHKRYPTRRALLVALAHDALDTVEKAFVDAGLDVDGREAAAALRRLVTILIPLGPRLEFLLRERTLDAEKELQARYLAVDRPVLRLVERGQAAGVLRQDLPSWWITTTTFNAIYGAWEAIDLGYLAPRLAPDLVLSSLLRGVAGDRTEDADDLGR